MKFFNIDGCEITRDEFIPLYGDSYYIGEKRYVPRVSQSSCFVEDEIDRLLKEGIKSKLDVVHILARKIGKIKHSDSDNKFVYAEDWKNAEKLEVTRYKKEFDIDRLAEYIINNIEALEEKSTHDPQAVLSDLNDLGITGLGSVYLITLLYFISKGKYPIYDRFAMMAVDAILADKKPGDNVEYHMLPDKGTKAFDEIMENHMIPYIRKLSEIFGEDCQKNRNIDRALWIYGHLFDQQ